MGSLTDRRAGGVQAAIRGARSARTAAALIACIPLLALAPAAFAQEVECGSIRWDAAAGPVAGYDVYVEINGGGVDFFASAFDDTEVVVAGSAFEPGDWLRFQVVAFASDGRRGPPSELSDVVFCQTVPTPQGVVASDGSAVDPILVTWEPVEHADFYAVFRSTEPGVDGEFVDRSDGPAYEDDSAELEVAYYYSVAAVAGPQISEFSEQAEARRGANTPRLVASQTQLVFQAAQTTVSRSIQLTNSGDWELAYQAWPGAFWLEVLPGAGVLEDETDLLEVRLHLERLAPGEYEASIPIYSYYDPPPDQPFALPEPLEIGVRVEVLPPNRPPVVESSTDISVAAGQTVTATLSAVDPDGDNVSLETTGLPDWASFQDLGNGSGVLTLSPTADAAGVWTGYLHAVDDAVPEAFTSQLVTLTVTESNQAPVLGPIPNQKVAVGETRSLRVYASDPDPGDRLAFMPSSLPDFVSFVDYGDGSCEFLFAPEVGDAASYLLILLAVDDGSPPLSRAQTFTLTVTAN